MGHYLAAGRALDHLEGLNQLGGASSDVVEEVCGHYRRWRDETRRKLDEVAEQYTEFVGSTQERLGKRMVLLAQDETVSEYEKHGHPHGR